MKPVRISIIGAGAVGATTAYALILRGLVAEIMLVDCDETRCSGEVLDLADVLPLSPTTRIVQGDLKAAAQADIVIIAVGKRQLPGQSREQLLQDNAAIVQTVVSDMKPFGTDTVIIVVTNPVDSMTAVVHKASELPEYQVFGSGTFLDTQRATYDLGLLLNVSPESIQCMVIGEHGPTACIPWSWASVGGLPLDTALLVEMRQTLLSHVRAKAELIIQKKQSTYFGIAACVAELCAIMQLDQRKVVPVSCFYEPARVYISVPVVLGNGGIQVYMPLTLTPDERKLFNASCAAVKNQIHQLGL